MAKNGGASDLTRRPRVHIEYEVPTDGAMVKVELPWVSGVLADLSGNAAEGLEPVAERKFRQVTAENFDSLFKRTKPKLKINVPNRLGDDATDEEMVVELDFQSMDDFLPDRIAERVGPLAKLMEARRNLVNLLANIDGKSSAEAAIEEALGDPALLQYLMDNAPQEEDAEAKA